MLTRRVYPFTARLALLALSLAACGPTPLPLPPDSGPALYPDLLTMTLSGGTVITGSAGALEPGSATFRVTFVPPPNALALHSDAIGTAAADGAFNIALSGTLNGTFFFEVIEADRDVFVGAITGGPDDSALEVEPGPDSDGDGSPDQIDCAPDDETFGGKRCN